MTNLKRWAWAAAVGVAASGPAFAQTTGTTTTATTTTGTTGGTISSGTTTTASSSAGGIQAVATTTTPTITSTEAAGTTASSAVDSSNGLAKYYNNPMYQGRAGATTTGLTSVIAPGGFGTVLYSSTGGSGAAGRGGTGGAAGSNANRSLSNTGSGASVGRTSSGLGGTSSGLGGGNRGGASSTQNNTNQQLTSGRQVSYTQTLRFPAPPPPPPAQLTSDLQTMLASSASLGGASGVQVTAGNNGVVLLRGTVADADEARVIAGMALLTPGVKSVQNELTIK